MSPECVCEVLPQSTLQIFLYSMLKLRVSKNALFLCLSL